MAITRRPRVPSGRVAEPFNANYVGPIDRVRSHATCSVGSAPLAHDARTIDVLERRRRGELSERRVEAAVAALQELGVSHDIIRTRSLGERKEGVTASEDERSEENRRVEIRIVSAELTRS